MRQFITSLFLPGFLLFGVISANAQGRVDSRTISCAEATAMVKSQGAVRMTTGKNTYVRVVKNIQFCTKSEGKKRVKVPTSDNPRCGAGYKCVLPAGKAG